jgi:hypothetical protein
MTTKGLDLLGNLIESMEKCPTTATSELGAAIQSPENT